MNLNRRTSNFEHRTLKIIMPVLHYYPVIGGLETWTQNIAERLSDKVETFVVTGKVIGQPKFEERNKVKIFRTSLFSLKNLSYSSPIYIFTALPFIFFKSLSLIRQSSNIEHRTSNILMHCQGFLSGFLGYFLSKITKIPYIVTVQRIEESKNFLKKTVYRNAKLCIAASSAIKKYFQEIGCENIEIIPNGIDLKKFEVRSSRLEVRRKLGLKNEFIIITVARLEKVKGINYLIEAINILCSTLDVGRSTNNIFNIEHRTSNIELFIIGDGSERKKLENLVKQLNLEDKIKFLGPIPNEKIPEYLVTADCFVLSSLKEGFGISILEAMAAEIPVIGTNVGGIPDIIENGKTGVLVEPKNPEAIAKAIIKIFSQPEFAKKLIENAKSNLEKYNWDNIAQKVSQVYLKFGTLA